MSRIEKLQAIMSRAIDQVALKAFGRTLSDALNKQICVACEKPAKAFRGKESSKEYHVSGLCQDCQDEIYE